MSDEDLNNAGSGAEDNEQEEGLTKEEEAKCWEAFSAFDKDSSGYIDANELRIVLEMMGQKTTEEEIFRMIAEADAENTGRITYAQFKRVIAEQKKNQSLTNEEDTLDAFVAMGGQPNGEGYIDAEKLIRIIKNEFEMTIDIEKLINDIDEDGSGKIEYDEFRNLLSSSD
ncbi:ef hand family protein [Stylonychia lemnae]|jgi:calmodulin|uniref:Calmodulin n=1 Tax=Stylonychia lemnae TaxID=5949 RepID=A0A078A814_STYLE|nr:ef hand family protein [Stylonychia lemnae]|eukprot:CDW78390.1 ef hand family protein [Stylonychia lemnae]